jgi:excisionase family DNA binding protein
LTRGNSIGNSLGLTEPGEQLVHRRWRHSVGESARMTTCAGLALGGDQANMGGWADTMPRQLGGWDSQVPVGAADDIEACVVVGRYAHGVEFGRSRSGASRKVVGREPAKPAAHAPRDRKNMLGHSSESALVLCAHYLSLVSCGVFRALWCSLVSTAEFLRGRGCRVFVYGRILLLVLWTNRRLMARFGMVPKQRANELRFYSVTEVAAIFGLSSMTVYPAIQDGEFPGLKIRCRIIVPAKAVEAMIEAASSDGSLVDAASWVAHEPGR